ncbi:hypothetical protein SAMN04487939_104277 [Lysobacter sp. yr284]|uniref:hypothetical protein n=1 Tax=Lysobacter sp. yr284 TaxID=1761791 RepID=UPI00089A9A98|nr:hypothetical protein [Lysobacter sp. yr284]SDY65505.1 hypothetical protein SAMN04487939_104277 [Lysobacter sp. yr284]
MNNRDTQPPAAASEPQSGDGAPDAVASTADAAAPALDPARWIHRLRNELNTASMACAAAQAVLAGGAVVKAQENLERARGACARAAALLEQAPPRA